MWPPENIIGLEVEMEGEGLMGLNVEGWKKDGDGSLRGHGVEFILEHPLSEEHAYKAVDQLYRSFKKFGKIKPSNRCGVHVHVNCQWMEIEQVFNYVTLYLILEDLIIKWCGEDREGNLFCLRAKDAEWLIYNLIYDKGNVGIFDETTNKAMYKYAAINVAAIRYYGSLEFRPLRTPSSPKPIKDMISLLLRIKEQALEVKEGRDFISACSARGETEWAREVLGPHFNMLRCEDMDEMIMDGVRRIQALAYTPLKALAPPKRGQRGKQVIYGGGGPIFVDEDGEEVRLHSAVNWPPPNMPNFNEPIREEAPVDAPEPPDPRRRRNLRPVYVDGQWEMVDVNAAPEPEGG